MINMEWRDYLLTKHSLNEIIDAGIAFFTNMLDDMKKRYREPSDVADVAIWTCLALPIFTLLYYHHKKDYAIIFSCCPIIGISITLVIFYVFFLSVESSFISFFFSGVYVMSGIYVIKSFILTSPFLYFVFVDTTLLISLAISIVYHCKHSSFDPKETLKGSVRPWFYLTVVILSFCINAMLLNFFTYYNHYGQIEISMIGMVRNISSAIANYLMLSVSYVLAMVFYVFYFMATKVHARWISCRDSSSRGYVGASSLAFSWFMGSVVVYTLHSIIYSYFQATHDYLEAKLSTGFWVIPLSLCVALAWLVRRCCRSAFTFSLTGTKAAEDTLAPPTPWWLIYLLCGTVFLTMATTLAVHEPVPISPLSGYCNENEGLCDYDPPSIFSKQCQKVNRHGRLDITLSRLAFMEYMDEDGQKHELRIIDSIASYWKDLAITFGLDWRLIALNRHNEVDYAKNCCLDALNEWRRRNPSRYPFSWDGLVKALRNMEMNSLAEDTEIALKCLLSN
jgi:hypothetical protein